MCGFGSIPKLLHGPTDIEGHIGVDGRHYVLDLARVFPPTCEDGSVKVNWLERDANLCTF
jgi:hypothetical protein